MPHPVHFTPGNKTRCPFYMRLGGSHGRSGLLRKISPPPGLDPWTFHPIASRYTGYNIPVLLILFSVENIFQVLQIFSRKYRVSHLKRSWTRTLLLNVPVYAGFLCDKTPVIMVTIKGTRSRTRKLRLYARCIGVSPRRGMHTWQQWVRQNRISATL
jgi:hypothetical protein